ncbi:hypothetical protein IFM89_007127 [Coptis chinensis]|uniref:Uncharacterized protein n=1 Tax=Coptis chinensis TaxID=261450 RepID=A0A835HCR8_9MAGN|nr:hypothetical protein IFM89_007127 [Coptis chinensis]
MDNQTNTSTHKYAVVTGANKGIGLAIVQQLAIEGITVVLTARNEESGTEAALTLTKSGLPNIVFHQLDVQDSASVETLAGFVRTRFGRLDILVNNAGASGVEVDAEGLKSLNIDSATWLSGNATNMVQGLMRQTYEKAKECIDTNYYGCVRVTEALLPLLQLSISGARIVIVSSLRSELKPMDGRPWSLLIVFLRQQSMRTMTVDEGARSPVLLALLPDGSPSGCYFDQTQMAEF